MWKFPARCRNPEITNRMFLKIEHLGIAVRNLESANKLFAALLGTEHYKREAVERKR